MSVTRLSPLRCRDGYELWKDHRLAVGVGKLVGSTRCASLLLSLIANGLLPMLRNRVWTRLTSGCFTFLLLTLASGNAPLQEKGPFQSLMPPTSSPIQSFKGR
jgi:hypothetical protein